MDLAAASNMVTDSMSALGIEATEANLTQFSDQLAQTARIIFLRCVPPSAPFSPLSAKMPSAVLSSVVPPASPFAVPPTVKMASPNCATLVFALLAVCAN